jgi:hypothetical protein
MDEIASLRSVRRRTEHFGSREEPPRALLERMAGWPRPRAGVRAASFAASSLGCQSPIGEGNRSACHISPRSEPTRGEITGCISDLRAELKHEPAPDPECAARTDASYSTRPTLTWMKRRGLR